MKTHRLLFNTLAVCCAGILLIQSSVTSPAQDLAAKGRAVLAKHQSSVVTVLLVMKMKMGIAGLAGVGGGDARESKEEVTGTVIDPSGLTVVALSSTDPAGLLQGMMGGLGAFGGDDGDGKDMQFKMDSEVTDVKLLSHDGTEIPAQIVLRDKDLDLAFIRPKTKPASPLPALDLSQSASVEVLDEVIAINRLGKVAGRVHAAAVERINAVVRKPRLFYVPGGAASMTGMGCPAFTPDGKVVGLFVMRALKSSGGGSALFGMQGGVTAILLPAEDVKKIAAQAPPVKDEAK